MSGECAGNQTMGPAVAEAGGTLDQLHRLLKKQLELVHQGRLAAAENLCEQTGPLVQTVVTAGMLAGPGGNAPRQSLLHLYQEICLVLTAQREEVSASLHTIRRGRRMLRTYGKNVS